MAELEGQITLDEWMQWKEDIRRKLKETAGNFVYIGCRLRQIRDSGMLDGAADIFEFAQREYGLSKSTTSRFIAVNERFADPYNPLLIKEEFENIGSSKLSEMLTLPDSECALITEKTTVKEIRDLKAFNKEAETLENVEESTGAAVATSQQLDDEPEEKPADYTALQKCIIEYFQDKQTMLDKALEQIRGQRWKEAFETVNPSGYASCKKGLCFLFMYEYSRGVAYKLMTEQAPVNMSWEDYLKDIEEIYGQQSWEEFYGKTKEEPKKPEEPEKKEKQTQPEEPQKPERITIHSVEPSIPEPDPIPEEEPERTPKENTPEEPEQQLPGQMEVVNTDMDMEEVKEKSEDQAPDQVDILVKLDELKQYVCTENWRKFAEELDALLKIAKEKEGEA